MVLIGLIVVAVMVVVGVWVRSVMPSAEPLQRVVAAFPVPAEWPLVGSQDDPPRLVCLGDSPCPSKFRRWEVPADYTPEEFQAQLEATGWDLELSETCERPLDVSRGYLCTARGEVDGVNFRATYETSEPVGEGVGSMSIEVRYPYP